MNNLEFDQKVIDEFVKDIQNKLPRYEVNESNVNDFSIMLEELTNCSKCKSIKECKNSLRGLKTVYIDNEFKYEECKYKKEERLKSEKKSLIKNLYLPSSILEADFSDYDLNCDSRNKIFKKTLEFIEKFKNHEFSKGLYIHGSFSIGKTYTLACISNELAKNDISCLLIYFQDLIVDLRNAQITERTRYEELINELKTVDVLMIDDFGSEDMTPWVRDEILSPILNYRSLEKKPVFISSNLLPSDIRPHLQIDSRNKDAGLKADRIISRLNSLCTVIDFNDSKKYSR